MPQFKIKYTGTSNCGVRFCDWEVIEAKDLEAAEQWAHEAAIDDYDQYEGSQGYDNADTFLENGEADNEEEAEQMYHDARESWLAYVAEPYVEGKDLDD